MYKCDANRFSFCSVVIPLNSYPSGIFWLSWRWKDSWLFLANYFSGVRLASYESECLFEELDVNTNSHWCTLGQMFRGGTGRLSSCHTELKDWGVSCSRPWKLRKDPIASDWWTFLPSHSFFLQISSITFCCCCCHCLAYPFIMQYILLIHLLSIVYYILSILSI